MSKKSDQKITQPTTWTQRISSGFVLATALSAVFLSYGIDFIRSYTWTPLQHYYWDQYTERIPYNLDEVGEEKGKYQLLFLERKKEIPKPQKENRADSKKRGTEEATTHTEFEQVYPNQEDIIWGKNGEIEASPSIQSQGWSLITRTATISHHKAYEIMCRQIYGGASRRDLHLWPLILGGTLWLNLFSGFIWLDFQRQKKAMERRVLRGTELVGPAEMEARIKGKSLKIPYFSAVEFWQKLFFMKPKTKWIHFRENDLTEHFLICGDTRQGKSVLMKWLLLQIRQRQERCIIYDPHLEFWEEFAEQNEYLLYPSYIHCPYWDIMDEIRTADDAERLARAFLPSENEINPTFWDTAKMRLLKFLFIRMKIENWGLAGLLKVISDEKKIDELITQYDPALIPLIAENAAPQRAGVFSGVTAVCESLRKLPPDDGRPHFSFRKWAEMGASGWVFIGNQYQDQEILKPVLTAWVQMMCSVLMTGKNRQRTYFFIDELPTLGRMNQLKNAIQQAGKYNIVFVLGFQGRAQLENIYGREAETLMSAPGIRVFLKTKEYTAAEWCAANAGKPEMERQVESITAGEGKDSKNYSLERKTDFLVIPNQFQNLSKRHGFLRYDQYLCEIRFPYPILAKKNSFQPRPETLLLAQSVTIKNELKTISEIDHQELNSRSESENLKTFCGNDPAQSPDDIDEVDFLV